MKLALGTAQFGMDYGVANKEGRLPLSVVENILSAAKNHNIDTLDTAAAYGGSEQTLGTVGVHGFNIVSKLSPRDSEYSDATSRVIGSLESSLENLGVNTLYGFLLHRPLELLSPEGGKVFEALQTLKEQGLIQKLGASVYGPEDLNKLSSHYEFDLVQAPMNLFDRRMVESGWLARLKQEGTEIHIRSAFLQGLLLMPAADRPVYFQPWSCLFERFDGWVKSNELLPLEACLGFLNNQPEVDKIVVGIDSVKQLLEVVDAASTNIPEAPESLQSRESALINPALWKL